MSQEAMTQQFAPAGDEQQPPTAITPGRVIVLSEDEQRLLLEALRFYSDEWDRVGASDMLGDRTRTQQLAARIREGDTYDDPAEEAAAVTRLRKRLSWEDERCIRRIADLTEPVLEQMQAGGTTLIRLPDGGGRIERDENIRLAYADPDWGSQQKAEAKEKAGDAFLQIGGDYASMLKQEWNHRRVESYLREKYNTALATEREKPEAERQPIDPDELAKQILPEQIHGLYRLAVNPRLKITAT